MHFDRCIANPPTISKVVFEGEEEAGSPHLRDILQENRALLAAELWVVWTAPSTSPVRSRSSMARAVT